MGDSQQITFQDFPEALLATVCCDRLDYMIIDKLQRRIATQATLVGKFNVILDLGAVEQISSLILSELVKTLKKLQNQGRRFILVGLDKHVHTSFQVTRMDLLFEIRPTVADALKVLALRPAQG